LTFFEYLRDHLIVGKDFAEQMSGYTKDGGSWNNICPVPDRTLDERMSKDGVLLVDVGGSIGAMR
jgi:hypothetical protein